MEILRKSGFCKIKVYDPTEIKVNGECPKKKPIQYLATPFSSYYMLTQQINPKINYIEKLLKLYQKKKALLSILAIIYQLLN